MWYEFDSVRMEQGRLRPSDMILSVLNRRLERFKLKDWILQHNAGKRLNARISLLSMLRYPEISLSNRIYVFSVSSMG